MQITDLNKTIAEIKAMAEWYEDGAYINGDSLTLNTYDNETSA